MNNEAILNKIDEIIKEIEDSYNYQKYLKLKQKDYVHHLCSKEELDNIINELNNHPLYREYLNKIDNINNTYSIIDNTINNYLKKKLENL